MGRTSRGEERPRFPVRDNIILGDRGKKKAFKLLFSVGKCGVPGTMILNYACMMPGANSKKRGCPLFFFALLKLLLFNPSSLAKGLRFFSAGLKIGAALLLFVCF